MWNTEPISWKHTCSKTQFFFKKCFVIGILKKAKLLWWKNFKVGNVCNVIGFKQKIWSVSFLSYNPRTRRDASYNNVQKISLNLWLMNFWETMLHDQNLSKSPFLNVDQKRVSLQKNTCWIKITGPILCSHVWQKRKLYSINKYEQRLISGKS